MTKGSIWRKWDFHLHTPYSILNSKFGNPSEKATWDNYVSEVERLSKENSIEAIGFTDYFTIEGYKKIKEYKSKGRLQNIFAFPNIEFRADNIISIQAANKNEDCKRINFHVIFSPDVPIIDLEENFLHKIDFINQDTPSFPAHQASLTVHNLEEYGKVLRRDHDGFKEKTDLVVGCENAVVNPAQIKDLLLKERKFTGKYLICLAWDDTSQLPWNSQVHGTRKILVQRSNCILSSNTGAREFGLGKRHSNPSEFLREFGPLKPCIWGCDSHGYEERFLVPDQDRFCWIKGDVTWEGLRQILYEPEERVFIQKDCPEPQKSIHTLDKLTIQETEINKSLKIKQTEIDFNRNLISIIGGRGSGKTALLDLIASCFKEGEKLAKPESSSFFRRVYGIKGNNPVTIKLGTKSNPEAIEKECGKSLDIIQNANITYITQNHFEDYSSNSKALEKNVLALIFESFHEELTKYNEMQEKIQEKQNEIQRKNLTIQQLIDEIKTISILNATKQEKEGYKKDYEERIHEIQLKNAIDAKLFAPQCNNFFEEFQCSIH